MKKFNVLLLCVIMLCSKAVNINAQLFGSAFKCYTISPPAVYLNNVKKVAVLNFSDETAKSEYYVTEGGTKVSDYIVQDLMIEERGLANADKLYLTGFKSNVFTIIERSQLDAAIKEQHLGYNGPIVDADAIKVGKALGIDAIISGSISYNSNDSHDQASSKDDKTGKVTTTYSTTRVVKTEARIKILSVVDGAILANANFSGVATDKIESRNSSGLKPVEELKGYTLKDIAYKISNYITPSLHSTYLDIKKIKTKEFKDKGKEASGYVKDNQIDKAILIYKDLFVQDSYNQEVAYDLGVVYEGTGHFSEALKDYKIALQLDASEKDYKNAVARVENDIQVVKFLADNGIQVTPYEFAAAGTGKLTPKIVTKGKKKDRYEVREQGNATSNLVAKVPGDTEFDIIKKEGDYYLIKLLGDQQGYILAKEVEVKK